MYAAGSRRLVRVSVFGICMVAVVITRAPPQVIVIPMLCRLWRQRRGVAAVPPIVVVIAWKRRRRRSVVTIPIVGTATVFVAVFGWE